MLCQVNSVISLVGWSKRMDLQRQAIQIVRDVIGIVLDWNNRYLSDKEAMKEITRSLLIHKNEKNGRNKVEEEKKDEIAGEEEKKQGVTELKEFRDSLKKIKFQKKFVAPLAISAFFIIVLVGGINLYDMISNVVSDTSNGEKSIQLRQTPTDDKANKNEQFKEIIPDLKENIHNNTKVLQEPDS